MDYSSGSMYLLTKNHGVWLPPFASALSEPKSAVPSTLRTELCPSVVPHDKNLQKHLPDAPRIVWLWFPGASVQLSGLWRRIIKAHISNLEGFQREAGKLRHCLETILSETDYFCYRVWHVVTLYLFMQLFDIYLSCWWDKIFCKNMYSVGFNWPFDLQRPDKSAWWIL